jgi:hypothetical protein
MTPPAFGKTLFYSQRIPGQSGAHIKKDASAPVLMSGCGGLFSTPMYYGLVEGPEPKSLWIRLELYHICCKIKKKRTL